MNTRISSQLAALALALVMNSVLIGGMACLFNMQVKHDAAAFTLERAAASLHEVV